MSKQTAKKVAGQAIAAAAASSSTTPVTAQPPKATAAPKHGAITKYKGYEFVHVGANCYNVFKGPDRKDCLASGVKLDSAKSLVDVRLLDKSPKAKDEVDHSASNKAITKLVASGELGASVAKSAGVPAEPTPKAAFDGIPSAEAQAKKTEAAGIIKRSSANYIDPKAIGRFKVEGKKWNNRFDMGDIEALAKSLEANGMLNPIRVQRRSKPTVLVLDAETGVYMTDETQTVGPIVFNLLDGDRRLQAIELLIKTGRYDKAFPDGIPAIIVEKGQDLMTSLFQMFEANNYKQLLPLEEAEAYQRMRNGFPEHGIKGLTIKQICEQVGRKQVHVVEMLNLLKADSEVKDAVSKGQIGKTMAKRIATDAKGDVTKQKAILAAAKSAGNSKGAKSVVKQQLDQARRDKAKAKGKTLKIRALDDQQLSALGAKVAATMAEKMVAADLPLEANMRDWLKGNPDLILAATFGALEALKAAAGMDIDLSF